MMPIRRTSTLWALSAVLFLGACTSTTAANSEPTPTTTPSTATTTSSIASSTTTPSTASTPVPERQTLLVLGDWGAGTSASASIAEVMEDAFLTEPYTTIVTTGDNFYKDDVAALFAPFAWTRGREIEWWASWGNHDIANQARITGIHAVLGETPNWAKFEWGVIDVIILDSNQIDNPAQFDFLADALDSTRPAIVVFHHPAFSCSKHGATADVVESWVPLFVEDGDVLLVLNGHDHNYQHFEQAGIDYVVSGGGGRGLYNLTTCPKDHPDLISGSKTHHFLRLVLDETGLSVIAIDATGTSFDSFTIPVP